MDRYLLHFGANLGVWGRVDLVVPVYVNLDLLIQLEDHQCILKVATTHTHTTTTTYDLNKHKTGSRESS